MTSDASPSTKPSKRRPRSAKVEQWDENDFDFSHSSRSSAKLSLYSNQGGPSSLVSNRIPIISPEKASPADSFLDGWDESPPRDSAPVPSPTQPHSLVADSSLTHCMPRHSPSRTSLLPSPNPTPPTLSSPAPSPSLSHSSITRSDTPLKDTSSNSGTVRQSKLKKRNPSGSFVPLHDEDPSSSSRFTQRLPRQPSREQMPPPTHTFPLFRKPKSAQGDERGGREGGPDPFSSGQSDGRGMKESMRRASNRSSMVSWPRTANEELGTTVRRQRSSSVGGSRSPTKSRVSAPPVPPIPGSIRTASSASDASIASKDSGVSNSGRKFSIALRRSLSSLSRAGGKSSRKPSSGPNSGAKPQREASDYFAGNTAQRTPSASSTSSSTSYPVSRGFHMPSPSLNSPYHLIGPGVPGRTSLPHSYSVPALMSDEERGEEESDAERTPRKAQRPRPLSVQPPPRSSSRGYNGDGWKRFSASTSASSISAQRTAEPSTGDPNSLKPTTPKNSTSAFWSSTAGRISRSVSRHGRRLSDTFRSTAPSGDVEESRSRSQILETVHGSPSKPETNESTSLTRKMRSSVSEDSSLQGARQESASAFVAATSASDQLTSTLDDPTRNTTTIKADKSKRTSKRLKIPAHIARAQTQFAAEQEALAEFYRGTSTLVQLAEELRMLQEHLRALGAGKSPEMVRLLKDFEPLNKRANAIIDWANTGQTPGTEPDVSMYRSSGRDRRVTFTSESAAAHAEALSVLMAGDGREGGNRSISLPEPDVGNIAPQADIPGPDRATTGRRTSPKKRMTIYEALGDVRTVRPSVLRGSSAMSTASLDHSTMSTATNDDRQPALSTRSETTSPETPDMRNYAPRSNLASAPPSDFKPKQESKPRRGRSGLGVFVLYLRSLRVPQSPKPFRGNWPGTRSRPTSSSSNQASPAVSPALSESSAFDRMPHPSRANNSFSQLSSPPPLASPQKNRRRSRMPSFFRSTSGNWTDLNQNASTPLPPSPTQSSKASYQYGLLSQPSRNLYDKPPPKRASTVPYSSDDDSAWDDRSFVELPAGVSRTDRTLRGHKSRLGGLGRPSSPSSPAGPPPPRHALPTSSTSTERVTSGTSDWSSLSDDSFLTVGTAGTVGTNLTSQSAAVGIPGFDGDMRFIRDTEIMAFGIEEVQHLLKEQRELLKEMRAWKRAGEEISGLNSASASASDGACSIHA